jgi:hypothetical protein
MPGAPVGDPERSDRGGEAPCRRVRKPLDAASENNRVPPPLAALAPVEHGPYRVGRVNVRVVPPVVGGSDIVRGGATSAP